MALRLGRRTPRSFLAAIDWLVARDSGDGIDVHMQTVRLVAYLYGRSKDEVVDTIVIRSGKEPI